MAAAQPCRCLLFIYKTELNGLGQSGIEGWKNRKKLWFYLGTQLDTIADFQDLIGLATGYPIARARKNGFGGSAVVMCSSVAQDDQSRVVTQGLTEVNYAAEFAVAARRKETRDE